MSSEAVEIYEAVAEIYEAVEENPKALTPLVPPPLTSTMLSQIQYHDDTVPGDVMDLVPPPHRSFAPEPSIDSQPRVSWQKDPHRDGRIAALFSPTTAASSPKKTTLNTISATPPPHVVFLFDPGGRGCRVATKVGGEYVPPPEPPDSDVPMEEEGSLGTAEVESSQGKVDSHLLTASVAVSAVTLGRSERALTPESDVAKAEGEMQRRDPAEGTHPGGRTMEARAELVRIQGSTTAVRPPPEPPNRAPHTAVEGAWAAGTLGGASEAEKGFKASRVEFQHLGPFYDLMVHAQFGGKEQWVNKREVGPLLICQSLLNIGPVNQNLNIQTENGLIRMPNNIRCVVVEYLAGVKLIIFLENKMAFVEAQETWVKMPIWFRFPTMFQLAESRSMSSMCQEGIIGDITVELKQNRSQQRMIFLVRIRIGQPWDPRGHLDISLVARMSQFNQWTRKNLF